MEEQGSKPGCPVHGIDYIWKLPDIHYYTYRNVDFKVQGTIQKCILCGYIINADKVIHDRDIHIKMEKNIIDRMLQDQERS